MTHTRTPFFRIIAEQFFSRFLWSSSWFRDLCEQIWDPIHKYYRSTYMLHDKGSGTWDDNDAGETNWNISSRPPTKSMHVYSCSSSIISICNEYISLLLSVWRSPGRDQWAIRSPGPGPESWVESESFLLYKYTIVVHQVQQVRTATTTSCNFSGCCFLGTHADLDQDHSPRPAAASFPISLDF